MISHRQGQTKRRVAFKPTKSVRTYPSELKRMLEEEKLNLHYSKDELKWFNSKARTICALSVESPYVYDRGMGPIEDIDSLRGLELSMYPRRKQVKILSRRAFLKYQALLNSKPNLTVEEKHLALAIASAKLSSWSSLVAKETAQLDAAQAHAMENT